MNAAQRAITVSGSYDLYIAEMNEIHRLMDQAKVPTTHHGEKLSASQRVAEAVTRLRKFQ